MSRSRQKSPVFFMAHATSGKFYRTQYHSRVRCVLRQQIQSDDFDAAMRQPRPSHAEIWWRDYRQYGRSHDAWDRSPSADKMLRK